ncbi:glycoside hydrolase family 3 protein [Puniceicoccus vermicola]|uniref:Glycoside hydrolase family 3 protein n=1 Tax=Puniceicoccus vermicola TaxID=388746 RepID=A0A7X1E3A3_9BACT|nr:glycoside hydrolase family 3 protein [Puniceicoccus vermicola]MBC2600861.1 glycoside hydrolase family 3 protein [Puniceicoccus vermicola]
MNPGQLLLVGIPGPELDPETANLYRKIQPGGFILFNRNLESPHQVRKLIDNLRDLSEIEPIITTDQEGGRVSRLRTVGHEPPNPQQLRQKGDPELIRAHGRLTGQLMRLFGFNLNLCPVLDISFDDEADNSLRGRCYGKSPEEVIRNARLFNTAMREEGIASCAKHFPGCAAATVDPHHELPVIRRSIEEMEDCELRPFRAMMEEIDSMMIGHSWYPCYDPEPLASSLSKSVIRDLLQENLGFKGLIMTDDLDMGALLKSHTLNESLDDALGAGNDLLMICHRVEQQREAGRHLEKADRNQIDRALENIANFKKGLQPPTEFSEDAHAALDQQVWNLRVDTLGLEQAKQRGNESYKCSPVEKF